jgi:hypothetical protein
LRRPWSSAVPARAAARQAARTGCVREARKVVDPLARNQIEGLCPTVK